MPIVSNKFTQYAIEKAFDEILNYLDCTDCYRLIKTGIGDFYQADSIGLGKEIDDKLEEKLGTKVGFLCTGGQSHFFINGKLILDINTPSKINKILDECKGYPIKYCRNHPNYKGE